MAQESWKRDSEEVGCQPPEGPVPCVNGCGFYGNKSTMDMCSKCFASQLKNSNSDKGELRVAARPSVFEEPVERRQEMENTAVERWSPEADYAIVTESPRPALIQQSSPPPPNRCFSCRKRVGLTGFKCRCEQVFCSLHRYSDKHDCSFDYKSVGRDAIAKANPLVKASKVDKI